jgi:hypothetical protein
MQSEFNQYAYPYSVDQSISQNEKLFQILEKLQSIIDSIKVRKEAEQFIYGVRASMDVILIEIKGKSNPNQESISYPE